MITPRFHFSQDENTFTITIRAPYCDLSELDVQIDEGTFLFYCKPYYLRLKLPGEIDEEHNARSCFNSDTGEFTFAYNKTNRGETFENLQLITQFLSPKLDVQEGGRKIEVLSSSVPQEEVVETEHQYGFAQRGGYRFNVGLGDYALFELDPCEIPLKDRKDLRMESEQKYFNVEHYQADFIDCAEVDLLINQTSPWQKKLKELNEMLNTQSSFTDIELDFLKNLPNLTYEISEKQTQYAFTGLVDILYAYCYDRRTTYFEGSCESGWTILKLSASMHWFDVFDTPREALISNFRRALIYPLYRNFNLCTQILQDLKDLLKLGEVEIIKALIDIYNIFLGGDSGRYMLNHLFIKDYVIYVQKWDKAKWGKIVDEVHSLQVKKADLELSLTELERAAHATDQLNEELLEKLEGLRLGNGKCDALDSDDDESEDSESDSTNCPAPSLPLACENSCR